MVSRVFSYSKETAKKNGNRLPVLELILITILFVVSMIFCGIFFNSMAVIIIFIVVFFALIIYYSIILGVRMQSKMTGYAIDENGRIFRVIMVNNGQGLCFAGAAAGKMVDYLSDNNSNIGGSVGGAIGAATQFYAMNRSAEYMSHPEIIAKIVESVPNVTGAEVFEVLKVYSITEKRKNFVINCDYKLLRTNELKYNKKITIEKSYIMYEELISALNTHK